MNAKHKKADGHTPRPSEWSEFHDWSVKCHAPDAALKMAEHGAGAVVPVGAMH